MAQILSDTPGYAVVSRDFYKVYSYHDALLMLHPNIIIHVENLVSLFSSPSTSSQKVQKCGGHKFLSQAI